VRKKSPRRRYIRLSDPCEKWAQIPGEGREEDSSELLCGLPAEALEALGKARLIDVLRVRIPDSETIYTLVYLPSLQRFLERQLPPGALEKPKLIPRVPGVLT
jgi:hypothetical protein